jgi:hypothetical protein
MARNSKRDGFKGYDAEEYARLSQRAKDAGLSSRAGIRRLDSERRATEFLGVDDQGNNQFKSETKSRFFDPKTSDDYDSEQDFDELTANSGRPARLTIIPTTSTNVSRPYTIAAGWERYPRQTEAYENSLGTLTCLFRDGTLYNYYDVAQSFWIKFSGAISKGQFLNRNSPNPELTNSYRHGPADMSGVNSQTRDMIYSTARRAQLAGVNKKAYTYTNDGPNATPTRVAKGTLVTKSARLKAGKNQSRAGQPKKP